MGKHKRKRNLERGPYDRYTTVPVEEIIPLLAETAKAEVRGVMVSVGSLRILTYIKGTTCVECGLQAKYWAIERNWSKTSSWHLNLYTVDNYGKEVMMTSDHFIPIKMGGDNSQVNRQPMCQRCNLAKGAFTHHERNLKKGIHGMVFLMTRNKLTVFHPW